MIRIVCIGKIKENAMTALIDEYLKRINGFMKITVEELAESKIKDDSSEAMIEKIKHDESQRILSKLSASDKVIALDIQGKQLDSTDFSKQVIEACDTTRKDVVFIIGGSYGYTDEVRSRADYRVSFSMMTFPHQLMRLILAEQLYRALMISGNRSYHK